MILSKRLFFILTLALAFNSYAQDSVYYHTAFNSQDDTLKARLNNIIKGHVEFPYTSSSTDVWDILKHTDKDTLDPDNVILIYSNRSVDAQQEYNGGSGWNREHVWAKSRGDFGTAKGPGTDVHHLRPCDISVNSARNNRNFDDCITCVDIIDNGFNTQSKRDANLWTFEPPDNVKGDIARMIFYMAVRYEGDNNEPDLELTNILQTNISKTPIHAVLNTLLSWNSIDPVSSWEQNRNLIIYNDYQGNRNPFIDYPELAEHLWGNLMGVVWKPVSSIGIQDYAQTTIEVSPNPTSGIVKVKSAKLIDEIRVINQQGQLIFQGKPKSNETIINLQNESQGMYFIQTVCNGVLDWNKVVLL